MDRRTRLHIENTTLEFINEFRKRQRKTCREFHHSEERHVYLELDGHGCWIVTRVIDGKAMEVFHGQNSPDALRSYIEEVTNIGGK